MRIILVLLIFPLLLSSVEFTVPAQAYDADIADIDNDGDLDIIIGSLVPGYPEPPDSLTFLINNGYGEFTKTIIPKNNFAYIKMVDIDCDGLLDICTKNAPNYQLVYYRNLGDLQFDDPTTIPVEYTYVFQLPKFNDIDSDGDMDIVINYGGSENECNLLINDGSGNFSEESIVYFEYMIGKFDVGDINHDEYNDILIMTNNRPYLLFNYELDFTYTEIDSTPWGKSYIMDMNNDQHNDIVLNNDLPSQTKILYNDGSGNFYEEHLIEMLSINILLNINDYNNDGYPDFAILTNPEPPNLYIIFNNGDGSISDPITYPFSNVNWLIVRSADLNGNGFNDLIVTGYPSIGNTHGASILFNDGFGNFLEEQTPFLQITPNSIHIDCNAGNTFFEIRSNTQWVIEQDEAWITSIEPLTGVGNAIVNISYVENPNVFPRIAVFIISGTDVDTEELVVTQSAASGIQNGNEILLNGININNYPNPFNPVTTISYDLPANVTNPVIEIFNIKGEKIVNLSSAKQSIEGQQYEATWDGTDQYRKPVSSGVYLYRIKSDGFISRTKRMLMLK